MLLCHVVALYMVCKTLKPTAPGGINEVVSVAVSFLAWAAVTLRRTACHSPWTLHCLCVCKGHERFCVLFFAPTQSLVPHLSRHRSKSKKQKKNKKLTAIKGTSVVARSQWEGERTKEEVRWGCAGRGRGEDEDRTEGTMWLRSWLTGRRKKKKKSAGPRVLHVVGVLVQPSVLSHGCLTAMEG